VILTLKIQSLGHHRSVLLLIGDAEQAAIAGCAISGNFFYLSLGEAFDTDKTTAKNATAS
jgi:hypothetical protein